ncbi:MAG: T9SS type A sorting domain-containing protein [Cyclobacteriaceae bacterium]|nr:T9SS type A sorting domain-containing protein [Cyclobacteriaceae bacterium]
MKKYLTTVRVVAFFLSIFFIDGTVSAQSMTAYQTPNGCDDEEGFLDFFTKSNSAPPTGEYIQSENETFYRTRDVDLDDDNAPIQLVRNWTAADLWEVWEAGGWVATSSFPNSEEHTVFIRANTTVNLDQTVDVRSMLISPNFDAVRLSMGDNRVRIFDVYGHFCAGGDGFPPTTMGVDRMVRSSSNGGITFTGGESRTFLTSPEDLNTSVKPHGGIQHLEGLISGAPYISNYGYNVYFAPTNNNVVFRAGQIRAGNVYLEGGTIEIGRIFVNGLDNLGDSQGRISNLNLIGPKGDVIVKNNSTLNFFGLTGLISGVLGTGSFSRVLPNNRFEVESGGKITDGVNVHTSADRNRPFLLSSNVILNGIYEVHKDNDIPVILPSNNIDVTDAGVTANEILPQEQISFSSIKVKSRNQITLPDRSIYGSDGKVSSMEKQAVVISDSLIFNLSSEGFNYNGNSLELSNNSFLVYRSNNQQVSNNEWESNIPNLLIDNPAGVRMDGDFDYRINRRVIFNRGDIILNNSHFVLGQSANTIIGDGLVNGSGFVTEENAFVRKEYNLSSPSAYSIPSKALIDSKATNISLIATDFDGADENWLDITVREDLKNDFIDFSEPDRFGVDFLKRSWEVNPGSSVSNYRITGAEYTEEDVAGDEADLIAVFFDPTDDESVTQQGSIFQTQQFLRFGSGAGFDSRFVFTAGNPCGIKDNTISLANVEQDLLPEDDKIIICKNGDISINGVDLEESEGSGRNFDYQWQYRISIDTDNGWINLSSTDFGDQPSLTSLSIPDDIVGDLEVRRLARVSECDVNPVPSNVLSFFLLETKTGEISGTEELCLDSETTSTFDLTDFNGNIINWEVRSINEENWNPISGSEGVSNLELSLTGFERGIYELRALVLDQFEDVDCSNGEPIPSEAFEFTLSLANAGELVSTDEVICIGESSGDIVLQNFTGEIIQWEKRIEGQTVYETIEGFTDNTYVFTPSEVGNYSFRVSLQDGSCAVIRKEFTNVIEVREILASQILNFDEEILPDTDINSIDLPISVDFTSCSGDTFEFNVDWDLSDFDNSLIGSQIINGEISSELGDDFQLEEDFSLQLEITIRPFQVESFVALESIEVFAETDFADLDLPSEVEILLEGGSSRSVGVVWDASKYSSITLGDQTIEGNLEISDLEDVLNPDDIVAEIIISVIPKLIVEVEVLPLISIEFDTELTQVDLPDNINVQLSDGSSLELPVLWDLTSFDSQVLSIQTIIGEIELIADFIQNPDGLFAEQEIEVIEADADIVTVVEVISQFDAINIVFGTAFADLDLPESAQVRLSNDEVVSLSIDWDEEAFNAQNLGTQSLEGSLVINQEGIVNTNELVAIQVILVEALQIINILPLEALQVDLGTSFIDASFPRLINVLLSDDTERNIQVQWIRTDYNPEDVGTQTVRGELVNLPNGVLNDEDLQPVIEVEVVQTTVTTINEIDDFNFRTYPNPVNNTLYIESDIKGKVIIYSLAGKIVKESLYESNEVLKIDVSSLLNGVYILHLHGIDGAFLNKKFIKH